MTDVTDHNNKSSSHAHKHRTLTDTFASRTKDSCASWKPFVFKKSAMALFLGTVRLL